MEFNKEEKMKNLEQQVMEDYIKDDSLYIKLNTWKIKI